MATTTQALTADELMDLPDDGFRYELVRGELIRKMATGVEQALIVDNCYWSLSGYARRHNLGRALPSDLGYRLENAPDVVRIPDLAFVRRERIDAVGVIREYFPGAPDMAIEVISPNDRYAEVESKLQDYFRAGTLMVILLESRTRTAKVYRSLTDVTVLTEADTLDGGDVVPGWRMPIADIFD